jgi:hypothetical protein
MDDRLARLAGIKVSHTAQVAGDAPVTRPIADAGAAVPPAGK